MTRNSSALSKGNTNTAPGKFKCICCGRDLNLKEFYSSNSDIYKSFEKIPYCKDCLDDIYQKYYDKYHGLGYTNPDRKAVDRICMFLDVYYSDKIFDSAVKKFNENYNSPIIVLYIQRAKLKPYKDKDYDDTILERYKAVKDSESVVSIYNDQDIKIGNNIDNAIKIFGGGFSNDDYIFLYDQYSDWIARHECDTKAKEELIKQICFTQLELLKANRSGSDTKDLNFTLTKLMDAAKLQPKQNVGDTTADNQTFGTLIDKWETTRPVPEVDDELKDVDKIGVYIDVFFRGHLSKMMGLKNGFSNLYNRFMKKYTVDKPEYNQDEDNEALFEAVFGNDSFGNDDVEEVLDGHIIGDEDE